MIRNLLFAVAAFFIVLAACAAPAVVPEPIAAPMTLAEASPPLDVAAYRDAGFLVGSGSIPFVGMIRFAATEYLDSTTVVISLSIPPRALSFVRAGDRYASFYAVRIDLLQGETIVRSERPSGEVRVASFAETARADEGVIFQRSIRLRPGGYTVRLTAQDSLGTGTGTAAEVITVPSFADGTVAPLIPVFSVEPRRSRASILTMIPNPRATVRYGRDTLLQFYLEGYGALAPDTLVLMARDPGARFVRAADTISFVASGGIRSTQSSLPVARLGLGWTVVTVSTIGGDELGSSSAFVTLGVDIPVASMDELLDALRFFASDVELQGLRRASVDERPAQWASLMRRADPNPATTENEALIEYARRLRAATRLYGEGPVAGWRTDRGAALTALGDPDSVTEPLPADSTGTARVITWDYRRHRLLLVFLDAAGTGAWKLTPVSESDFRSLIAISGSCIGCR